MDRELSLVVYHSPLFPAHWALYIPSMTDPAIGKIVHVTGDARNGIIPLARISASHVVDVLSPSGLLVYTAPDDNLLALAVDNVERELLSIPAPGKSLNVVDSLGRSQGRKVAIKNCQTWIRDAVERLVHAELHPNSW
ncbi:unnamed protein product [Somion occarium]|uniref:Uncharacterized protein n=1 Tax=Somion occarium TaxID=3059160 RepID=A0ABP1CWG1_9APHY